MRSVVILLLGLGLLAQGCRADEQVVLKERKAKEGYSLGYEFGASIRVHGVEVDADVLLSAVREAVLAVKACTAPP